MSFQEIIGQEAAVALLKNAFKNKRLSHAYLFLGPEGIGKKKTAINFTKLLLCECPSMNEPCDRCAACLKVAALNHSDVQWVVPDGQYIKIDSIREACRRLNLKGFESSKKILIVSEAQSLNEESSNALLKTLEEPSGDTVIILLADALKSILPTIRSRCQRIVFSVLAQEKIEDILKGSLKISEAEAAYLGRISAGSLGVALQYHESGLFLRKNKILDCVLRRDARLDEFFAYNSNERSERNLKMEEIFCVLSSWFRDLLLAKMSLARENFINADRKDDIITISRRFTLLDIESRISAIADAAFENEHNVNGRILLTNLRVELWK